MHATAQQAILQTSTAGQPLPRLIEANADVIRWIVQKNNNVQISLRGHLPVEAEFALPPGWSVQTAKGASVEKTASGVRISSTGTTTDLALKRA